MKISYEIVKVDDRLFFNDGKQHILFDSGFIGNPFGKNSVAVNGKIGDIAANAMPKNFFDSFINMQVNGCDVTAVFNPMDGYNCLLKGNVLTISDEEMELEKGKYFFPFIANNLPLIEGCINGKKCKFFFDSGARMTMFGDRSDAASEKLRTYTEWMAAKFYYADLDVFKVSLGFPNGFEYEGEGALVTDADYLKQAQGMNIRAMLGIDIFKYYNMAIITRGAQCGIMLFDK